MNTPDLARWIEDNGLHNVGPTYVTLCNYDGDEGIRFHGSLFSDDPLGDALAHARRFCREVRNADEVGAEESNRQVEAWLATNGHDAPARTPERADDRCNCGAPRNHDGECEGRTNG